MPSGPPATVWAFTPAGLLAKIQPWLDRGYAVTSLNRPWYLGIVPIYVANLSKFSDWILVFTAGPVRSRLEKLYSPNPN